MKILVRYLAFERACVRACALVCARVCVLYWLSSRVLWVGLPTNYTQRCRHQRCTNKYELPFIITQVVESYCRLIVEGHRLCSLCLAVVPVAGKARWQ